MLASGPASCWWITFLVKIYLNFYYLTFLASPSGKTPYSNDFQLVKICPRPIRTFSRQRQGGSCAEGLDCGTGTGRAGSYCRFVGSSGRGVDAAAWPLLSELELVERRAKSDTRGFSPGSLAGVEWSAAGRQHWRWMNMSVVSHSSRKRRIITRLVYWRRRNLTSLNALKSSALF